MIESINKEGYIDVEYMDGTASTFICNDFGINEDLQGFITFWSSDSTTPMCLIRTDTIRKIVLVKENNDYS